MLRLDGLRRAQFFDDSAMTDYTLETYERLRRPFKAAAELDKILALEASEDWILAYFAKAAAVSIETARKQVPAVAQYFRINGCGERFPYDAVSDLLRPTSTLANDPLGAPLEAAKLNRTYRRRARALSGKESDSVRKQYAKYAQGWEVSARRYNIDPRCPPVAHFIAYLSTYARTHRFRSVSNLCCAISSYFRGAQAEDLTRHEKVREFLAVLAREDAKTTQFRPLYAEDVRAMVAPMGDSPLDVRDRNVIIAIYLGPFFAAELQKINNNVELRSDGIVVDFDGQPIFIGGVDDPDLDVRVWMPRWLKILGTEPRPLFPATSVRGNWTLTPLRSMSLSRIVHNAARRAGINVPYPSLALRKGFAIRVCRAVGPVQTAAQMRLKRTTGLGQHVRLDQGTNRNRKTPGGRVGSGLHVENSLPATPLQ